MNIYELAKIEKIEEKMNYKELYREVFLGIINDFFPKYITSGKTPEFFDNIKKIVITHFEENIGTTNSLIYTENLSIKLKEIDVSLLNKAEKEYWNFLQSKIISSSKELLLTKTNDKITNYIDYLKKQNDLIKKSNTLKKLKSLSFYSLNNLNSSSDFKKSIKKLQQIREKYQVEIIVANNISWPNVYQWAKNIEKSLDNTVRTLGISPKNNCFKEINLICCEEVVESAGLFAPHSDTNYIKICLKDEKSMYQIWLHELTHFLDFKTCEIIKGKNNTLNSYYFSEHIIFNQFKNYYSDIEENYSKNKLMTSSIKFLKMALGVDYDKDSNTLQYENEEKIIKIENYFYAALFEKNNIPYEEKELILLRTGNFEFLSDLVVDISQLSHNETNSFIKNFYEKNTNQLNYLLKNIPKKDMDEEKQKNIKNTLFDPEFLRNYIEVAKKFFHNEGIIVNKFLFGAPRLVSSSHQHIKKSIISYNPQYWASIVEIAARTVEGITHEKIEKSFIERFKILGNKTLSKAIEDSNLSPLYSPKLDFYTQEKISIIKIYLKDMIEFIDEKLSLDLEKTNTLPKNVTKSL